MINLVLNLLGEFALFRTENLLRVCDATGVINERMGFITLLIV